MEKFNHFYDYCLALFFHPLEKKKTFAHFSILHTEFFLSHLYCLLLLLFFICALFLCHSLVFMYFFCCFNRFPVKETWKIWSLFVDLQFSRFFFRSFSFSFVFMSVVLWQSFSTFLVNCFLAAQFAASAITTKWMWINKTNLSTIKVENVRQNDFEWIF